MNDLFDVKQSPIINYSSLDAIADGVKERLEKINASSLIVGVDNVKSIKELRATLNKEFKEFDEKRMLIKKTVLEPYEKFETEFKTKIANLYKDADTNLKSAIDSVENSLKKAKEDELREYFEEYAFSVNNDFVKFEDVGLSIGLNDSVKYLKENIAQFFDNIESDIALIKTQGKYERILIRYKKTLDVRESIASVIREDEEIAMAIQNKPVEVSKAEPIQVKTEVVEPEPILTVGFTIKATKTQVIALREFMKKEGIYYE